MVIARGDIISRRPLAVGRRSADVLVAGHHKMLFFLIMTRVLSA